jgi:hypothetical protein
VSGAFRWTHPLVLDGFPYEPPPWGHLEFRALSSTPAGPLFDRFADDVIGALGREARPVYRMADGEFQFLLGERDPYPGGGWLQPSRLRARAGRVLRRIRRRPPPTVWGEHYSAAEHRHAVARLTTAIRQVAATGVLGAYFMRRADGWGEGYFPPVCRWLDRQDIGLTASNYIPFYCVYALLTGPRRVELLRDRHVLVVTHLTPARRDAIARGLAAEGVASVQFAPVSADRALFDTLDLAGVQRPVDIALAAAGIGTAAVLTQLAPLAVPAIDCGIVMECFIDDDRRWERPFLVADDRVSAADINRRRRF